MAPASRPRLVLREKLHVVDYALVLLAFSSLVVFLVDRAVDLAGAQVQALLLVDLALVGAYGLLFVAKTLAAREPARWLRAHALLLLGLHPVTIGLVGDPWFLLVQVVVLILRAGKALDKAFGQHVLAGMSARYRAMVVEEATEPLLMRLAVLLEESVTSRDYAAAIGKRLDERRDLVEAAVARAVAASPKLSAATRFSPVRRWVDDTTREIVDAAHAALTGPEVNTLIREAFQDAFAQLKEGIRERKWQRTGVGLKDVAEGVLQPRRGETKPAGAASPVAAGVVALAAEG